MVNRSRDAVVALQEQGQQQSTYEAEPAVQFQATSRYMYAEGGHTGLVSCAVTK